MTLPPFDLSVVATIIAAVFGGAGVKIIEKFLSKDKEKTQDATLIRNELRKQITGLKNDIVLLKKENISLSNDLDIWQEKYWELKARNVNLQGQIDFLTHQVEDYLNTSEETPVPPTNRSQP